MSGNEMSELKAIVDTKAQARAEAKKETRLMYYLEKKEIISEKQKEYRKANEEKIQEHNQKLITCTCGCEITLAGKSRHLKSDKHKVLVCGIGSKISRDGKIYTVQDVDDENFYLTSDTFPNGYIYKENKHRFLKGLRGCAKLIS